MKMSTTPKDWIASCTYSGPIKSSGDFRPTGFRRAFPTLLATLTAVAAVILYISMQQPAMTTLYSSVSEAEKSKIIDSLKNMGIEV